MYLSGHWSDACLPCPPWLGAMLTPRAQTRPPNGVAVALDNGCFRRDRWTETKWLAWLDLMPRTALFAVAPDVVADAGATLQLGEAWLEPIRGMGFRPAFLRRAVRRRNHGMETVCPRAEIVRRCHSTRKTSACGQGQQPSAAAVRTIMRGVDGRRHLPGIRAGHQHGAAAAHDADGQFAAEDRGMLTAVCLLGDLGRRAT